MARRVSSPRFVGREAELHELSSALEAARGGDARTVLLAGESGIGKSRLVAEFLARARDGGGARVLVGDCLDLGDAELPYAPVVAALRGLSREHDPSELEELLGGSRDVLAPLVPDLAGAGPGAADAPVAQPRLFETLLALLRRLGGEAPVVLVCEDLHWADRSTRDFLAFLVRNARQERVLLVGTYRSDELHRRHPLRPFLTEVDRAPGVVRLEVERFTREELAEQAAGILGAAPDAALVEELFARAEGNAFFTEELVAARASGQRLPETLRDALMLRVEALPGSTQHVLRVAAAAGRQVGHRLLAAAAGVPEPELLEGLREAVAHNVLVHDSATGAYNFRHALQREALEDDLLPGERAPLHARIAAALEEDPSLSVSATSNAAELAFHWSLAYDAPRAFAASVRAGEEARRLPAYAEAKVHFERALELLPRVPEDQRAPGEITLLRWAADAALFAGEMDRASALARQAIALVGDDDAVLAARLHARLGRYLWVAGLSDAALETLERAVALMPRDAPPADRARVLGALGHVLMLLLRGEEARATLREALTLATEADARPERAHILISLGSAAAAVDPAEEVDALLLEGRRLASELGVLDEVLRSYVNRGDALDRLGRVEEAVDDALEGWRLARREGMHVEGSLLASEAAMRLMRLGRWDEAAEVLGDAEPSAADGVTGGALVQISAELAALRGDAAAAERLGAEAQRRLVGAEGPMWKVPLIGTAATIALWAGRPAEASAAAVPLLDGDDDEPDAVPYVAPVLALGLRAEADLAVSARALGDAEAERAALERADRLASRLQALPRGTDRDSAAAVATGVVEAARAHGRATAEDWAAVAADWEALPRPFAGAYARWREAGAALDEGSGRARAEAPLRAAAEGARRLGARPLLAEVTALARRARIELAAGPAASAGGDADARGAAPSAAEQVGLTARELEVLRLVADGATNREIGERLFMSQKTASVHISRILAKLDARGRVEAATLAHRLGLLEDDEEELSPAPRPTPP